MLKICVTSVRPGQYLRVFTPTSPRDLLPLTHVYVGREVGERTASPLANPYRLRNEDKRGDTIENYRHWLHGRMYEGSPQLAELERIAEIAKGPWGVALGCWCAPLACHGDVIREFVINRWGKT